MGERRVQSCFRPLSGSYISQFNPDTPCKKETRVSVPYRGATFLNNTSGDSIDSVLFVSVPYRGATFLNSSVISLRIVNTVSVPYRGAKFLNGSHISFQCYLQVSVPYRGATFLNTIPATPCPVWDE